MSQSLPVAEHETQSAAATAVRTSKSSLPAWLTSDLTLCLLITALCFTAWWPTLHAYLINDDLICLRFVYSVVTRTPEQFLRVWTTGLPEIHTFLWMYRPLPYTCFLLAYLVFGAKAVWYHIANLSIHSACSVIVFFLVKELCRKLRASEGTAAAFVAAALFATYPLLVEPVAWCGAAFDLLAALFFLLTILSFVRSVSADRSVGRGWRLVSYVTCLCGFLSKENAIVVPAILVGYCLCAEKEGPLVRRLVIAINKTAPYWLLAIGYLVVRASLLSTPIGGYGGVIGDWYRATFWQRLAYAHGGWQFLFPINQALIDPRDPGLLVLAGLYAALLLTFLPTFLSRIAAPRKPSRFADLLGWWLIFSLGVVCLPSLPIWFMGNDLSGGRHYYLIAALLLMLVASSCAHIEMTPVALRCARLRAVILSLVALTFIPISRVNSEAWLDASRQVLSVRDQVTSVLAGLPDDARIVLLSLPVMDQGVVLFYRSLALHSLLRPPFVATDVSGRVDLPQQMLLFGNGLISVDDLRLFQKQGERFYTWDNASGKMRPVNLNLEKRSGSCDLQCVHEHKDQTQQLAYADFVYDNKYVGGYDFIEMCLRCRPLSGTSKLVTPSASIRWDGFNLQQDDGCSPMYLPVIADGSWRTYYFPVCELKDWYCSRHNGLVRIALPSPGFANELQCVRATDGRSVVPAFSLVDDTADRFESGVHYRTLGKFALNYSAATIPGAAAVVFELSKPGSMFELERNQLHSGGGDAYDLRRFTVDRSGQFLVDLSGLPIATYELRAAALSATGTRLGYYTNPIFLSADKGAIGP